MPMRPARPNISAGVLAAAALTLLNGAVTQAALGQIAPERLYNAVGRPLRVGLRIPAEAEGAAKIQLLEPVSAKLIEEAAVSLPGREGSVDLVGLFPKFWAAGAAPRLVYAQLVVGDEPFGPAVVLQPMMTPTYAPRSDRSGAPMYPSEKDRPRVYSGVRAYVDRTVVLETSRGKITIGLRPDVAPNTSWNFRQLVEGGLYDGTIVHRIASLTGGKEPDIVQAGDPNGSGQGGPGYFIDIEPSSLPHDFGVLSAARFSDPNSSGSQFMICLNREGTAYMDGRYTAFGVVLDVDGSAEALRSIAASPVGADNRPLDPPVIRSAKLVDAAPYGQGPRAAKDPLKKPKER